MLHTAAVFLKVAPTGSGKDMELTSGKVAEAIFVPRTRIERIVKGEMDVTADTPSRPSRFVGTSAGFWMNLQRGYDLDMAAIGGGCL